LETPESSRKLLGNDDDVINPKVLQSKTDENRQANGRAKTPDKKTTKNGAPPVVLLSKKMLNNESFDENYNTPIRKKNMVDDKSDSQSTSSKDDASVMSGPAVSEADLDNLSLSSTHDPSNEETDTLAPLPSSRASGNVSASTNQIPKSTNPMPNSTNHIVLFPVKYNNLLII